MTAAPAPDTVSIPASHLDLLTRPICGVLTTMAGDGQPQSSLVWVDHDGPCARVNTTLECETGRNLGANPKVSLLVVDPDNTVRFIQIRGDAELVTDGADEHLDALTRKYTRVTTGTSTPSSRGPARLGSSALSTLAASRSMRSIPEGGRGMTPTGADAVITATGLTKTFGAIEGVQGVDLDVWRGEIFSFLGPNGAGKSTTINMLHPPPRMRDERAGHLGRRASAEPRRHVREADQPRHPRRTGERQRHDAHVGARQGRPTMTTPGTALAEMWIASRRHTSARFSPPYGASTSSGTATSYATGGTGSGPRGQRHLMRSVTPASEPGGRRASGPAVGAPGQ